MNHDPKIEETNPQKAVIYCRVSDPKQRKEGNGLDSQEHRCRQYAEAKGYEVEAVFPDDMTGGGDFMKRPGMVALLAYLDAKPDERYVVIFDDLKRYARDTEFHLKLRRIMTERGATRECLNFSFENSPEGKFFETIAAAQGELEREQNGRQVRQKMRARAERGYYCFGVILGYRYIKSEDGGKILHPDAVNGPIVKEALEGFAAGRFQTASEVMRFLNTHPTIKRRGLYGQSRQMTTNVLRNPIYAGYMTVKKLGLTMHPAKHEPLIDLATWRKIQERLDGNAYAPARKDLNRDFPLRGFVACASCGNAMTSGWSKGRNGYYPYYLCQTRHCEMKGKSIRKETLEGEFAALLQGLTPARPILAMVKAMFADCWTRQAETAKVSATAARSEISAIERKIETLSERIVEARAPAVIQAYESQIEKLSGQRADLAEIAAKATPPKGRFEDVYRTALDFLSNPHKLWVSGQYELQRLVLRLAFTGRIQYARNDGYRTAPIAEPLRLAGTFSASWDGMVGPAGFEPATKPL